MSNCVVSFEGVFDGPVTFAPSRPEFLRIDGIAEDGLGLGTGVRPALVVCSVCRLNAAFRRSTSFDTGKSESELSGGVGTIALFLR